MTKLKTESGKQYQYIGTVMKKDVKALECLLYLREKGYEPDMVAISMRMLHEVKR